MKKISKLTKEERAEYADKLRATLKPGDTIHTVMRHRSASGMMRVIDCYHLKPAADGKGIVEDWLSYWAAAATGFLFNNRPGQPEGVRVRGCGMDMGFHLVYSVSRVLFPDGFGIVGKLNNRAVRPRNKAHAAQLVAKGAEFHGRNGDKSGWDNDGGYALNQKWL